MKNEVKKSINILQKLYMNGLIPYPRVGNDFELKSYYQLFPHPPLPILNGINEPIKKEKIQVNKKSSLLFLNLLSIIKPSRIEKISEKIDDFFDEELQFINVEQQKILMEISSQFDVFLQTKNLTEKDLISLSNSYYAEDNKTMFEMTFKLYEFNKFIFNKENKEKKKNRYLYWKKPIKIAEEQNIRLEDVIIQFYQGESLNTEKEVFDATRQ